MADLSITAASVLASANCAPTKQYLAGATITQGALVYLDPTLSVWKLTDADAASTGNLSNSRIGIALVGAANNQPMDVAERDVFFTPGATLTNGIAYYASRNAGAICPVADVGAGNYATFVGIARTTAILNLNPTAAGVVV